MTGKQMLIDLWVRGQSYVKIQINSLTAIFLIIMAVLLNCIPATAGLYEKGGANGLGARAMGMAGAYTALAEDETAVWWNPAGLGEIDTLRIGTSLGSLYDGQMRSINLSAAMPLSAGAAAGINLTHDAYLQSAAIHSDTLALAGSIPLSRDKKLYLGTGLKILFGNIPRVRQAYAGMGLDIGLRYKFQLTEKQFLSLALKVQDLDTRIKWSNGVLEQIPQSIAIGSAWHLAPYTTAVMDLEMVHSGQEESHETRILRIGIERWFRQIIGMRAGYMLDSDYASTFSFGAGVKVSGWEVQYALLGQIADLGLSHRLTFSYGLPTLPAQIKPMAVSVPVPTPVTSPQFKLELIALPEVFSPNGESLTDSVVFHLRLIEGDWVQIGSWRLRVENTESEVVREFKGNQYTEQFEWDGLDREGKICADGPYEATLVLFDFQGNRLGEASVSVLVRTQIPSIGLRVYPRKLLLIANRPQRSIRFRTLNTADLSGVNWTLVVRTLQGYDVKTFQGEGTVPQVLRWNGLLLKQKPIAPGSYKVVLTVSDSSGQVRTAVQQLTVSRIDPKIRLEVSPRLIKLGAKQRGKATFSLSVQPRQGIRAWRLEIRNAQNETLVRSLSGVGLPPATVMWDCRNQKGKLVRRGGYFHARLILSYGGKNIIKSPVLALATDIRTKEAGRSLALHLTMVTFKSGSSAIRLNDFKRLKQASETVKKYAKRYSLQIKGYTDHREAKGYELELSWERARKVKEYLHYSCGIPDDRMQIVGYGSRLPLVPETSSAARARNRRVEVVLIIRN